MKLIRKLIGWSILAAFLITFIVIMGPIVLGIFGLTALFLLAVYLISD